MVRYGELGTKSDKVRSDMTMVLRQRIQDRLAYENLEFETVSTSPGRIVCRKVQQPGKAAKKLSELPGVASTSPAYNAETSIESVKDCAEDIEVGESFGVDASTAGEHGFDSQDVERELGSFIQDRQSAEVDLDGPETLVEVDIRFEEAFVFTKRFSGPQGFPAGTGDGLVALVSGGIDSPIAAYRAMVKGSRITPVYFYNKPVSAEDHLMRFKECIRELRRFNPSKTWEVYVVDMEEVNRKLMEEIDRGRMLIHRRIMFRVAEKIKNDENLSGIVTGESMSQKSSQTASNLELTSKAVESEVFRPLLSESKYEITSEAREIGTFKYSKINSACKSLAPENPATRMSEEEIHKLEEKVDAERLAEEAYQSAKKEKISG